MERLKVLIASQNNNKITEIKEILSGANLQFIDLNEISAPSAEESGLTFVENAITKARYAFNFAPKDIDATIADDSGLCVKYLDGEPGVFSARYAEGGDNEKIEKLLYNLKDVTNPSERYAEICCCAVFMLHERDPKPLICEGTLRCQIMFKSEGTNGFGYDSILYSLDDGCGLAEMTSKEKNANSHRYKAFSALAQKIKSLNL